MTCAWHTEYDQNWQKKVHSQIPSRQLYIDCSNIRRVIPREKKIRASVHDNRSGQTTPVKRMTVYSVGVVRQILPFITLHPYRPFFRPLFSPCGPLLNSESCTIPTYSNMSRLLDHDHQRLHKERNDLPPGGKTRNPARNCNTFQEHILH